MDYEVKILNSVNYIEENLCKQIKLNDIAKQSYFSEFYFHKLFRSIIGTSVMDYVRKRRLTEAAIDLSKTDEKITGIAFKYQFSSEESFSRAFRKMYGMSPRNYRNNKIQISCSENIFMFKKYAKQFSHKSTALFTAA
jgi:AraC family transcriptional regulator